MKTLSKLDETKIIFSKSNMKSITEYNFVKDENSEKNEDYDKVLNLISISLQLKLIRNFDNETKFDEILETEFDNKFYLRVFDILNGIKPLEEVKSNNVELNITSKSNSTSTTKTQQKSTSVNKIEIFGNVSPGSRIVSGNYNIVD